MSHRRQSSSAGSGSSPANGEHGVQSGSSTEGNVQVVLRIRPINAHDLASIPPRFQRISLTPASSTTVSVDAGSSSGSTAVGGRRNQTLNFHYDRVLGPDEGQRELYEAAASKLVAEFIQGFNVTILAYGQTSSGKSYSMGTALDAGSNDERDILPTTGLVPRAVTDIFAKCAELERQAGGRANVRFEMTNSFVELYNEDLLDLLSNPDPSTPVAERPTVSIREDKDGHIIWSGLRELKVSSKEDVMRNLQQGSTLRRTNETDMNAQSSRSHAIFSLTLTQRKRVGGSPPASAPPSAFTAPASSTAPSTPSRGIPRPASVIAGAAANSRNMSPTPGSRPTTPSGLPLLHQRTVSGLRTASTVGTPRATSPLPAAAESSRRLSEIADEEHAASPARVQSGEWVTVTSKFHFVDLAGSERLKRTSAAGERMKEGISINSGLLALGNVISALGDPAKARTMIHIPYRDSKLTRLLQDSLGGNAHTLMIACVSPAEFNLTETLSTIKYANRARNIKNRAEVNQMEVGWDDIEHLQTTLVKLRKEHAALKAAASQAGVSVSVSTPHAGPDLSSISEEKPSSVAMNRLNSQFSDLQEEHARLSDRYRETMVEVARLTRQVEEAKSHGRDSGSSNFALMVQPVIEEYEKAISQLEEELKLSRAALAHTNDLYNEQEIQLSNLTSRNAKTETYNAELRARLNKLAERESSNESYIRDLEAKLSSFNERDETRGGQVASLKKEIAQLKQADSGSSKYISDLEAQLAKSESAASSLSTQVDRLEKEVARREEMYKDLEARLNLVDTTEENKQLLHELEEKDTKVADLERKLEEAFRTMEAAGKERAALQKQAANDESERNSLKTRLAQQSNGDRANGRTSPELLDGSQDASANTVTFASASSALPATGEDVPRDGLDEQLRDLQVAHTRTLAELDDVSAKYRDALKEIADLSAQVQEADLRSPSTPTRGRSPSPTGSQPSETTPLRKSGSRSSLASLAGSPGSTRHRIGQGRNSLPGGSTLARDPSSPNGQGFGGRGGGHPKPMPMSLSQEFSSLPSSRSSWGGPGATLLSTSPVSSLSPSPRPERTVQSLEDEIMSLQKVLKQREEEIDHLENSLKHTMSRRLSSSSLRSDAARDSLAVTSGEKPSLSRSSSIQQLDAVPEAATDDEMQSRRMEDLLKSMARMETAHRETVEGLTSELTKVKRDHSDLVALSRDQALNVSAELDGLRTSLRESEDMSEDLAGQLEARDKREQDAVDSRSRLIEEHDHVLSRLRSEHSEALQARERETTAAVDRLNATHGDDLKRAEVERGGTLSESQEEHATAISTLHQQHSGRILKMEADFQSDLDRLKAEHSKSLEGKTTEHATVLERLQADHAAIIARLTEEKTQEADRLRAALSKSREEHVAALQAVREEADRKVQAAEEHLQATLNQTRADHENALDKLEEDLSKAVVAAEDALGQLDVVKEEHARELARVKGEPRAAEDNSTVVEEAIHKETQSLQSVISAQKLALETEIQQRSVVAARSNELQTSLESSATKIAELENVLNERDLEAKGLLEEIDALQSEIDSLRVEQQRLSQTASLYDSLLSDFNSHRTSLASVQQELHMTRAELESLLQERARQEDTMRDLQRRLSDYTAVSVATDSSEFLTDGKQRPLSAIIGRSSSPIGRHKPPPPTPPPNMPPPPLPSAMPGYSEIEGSSSRPPSQMNTIRTNSISSSSGRRSPRSANSIDGNAFPVPPPVPDLKLLAQLDEQRVNVKNLNKRLQHCEADLQANIDLVNTLEAALNDSERALRKARLSANDIAKERDRASSECETLRSLLQHARAEVLSVKSSADNDSRQLEEKMAFEMRQRENAKRELEERLEAMQSRKSKFNCF